MCAASVSLLPKHRGLINRAEHELRQHSRSHRVCFCGFFFFFCIFRLNRRHTCLPLGQVVLRSSYVASVSSSFCGRFYRCFRTFVGRDKIKKKRLVILCHFFFLADSQVDTNQSAQSYCRPNTVSGESQPRQSGEDST